MILTTEEDEAMNGILNDLETVRRGTDYITGQVLSFRQKQSILTKASYALEAMWQAEGNTHGAA